MAETRRMRLMMSCEDTREREHDSMHTALHAQWHLVSLILADARSTVETFWGSHTVWTISFYRRFACGLLECIVTLAYCHSCELSLW